jgi:hypothetical protein
MELSIITATIPERAESLSRLKRIVEQQSVGMPVEHIIVEGDGTIGRKINTGFYRSNGRYVCVVDDDDTISDDYVVSLLQGIRTGADVVTLGMQIPGQAPIWLRAAATEDGATEKMANHLCAWNRHIALAAPLLPRNYGWDVVWYRSIRAGFKGLREYHIPRVLYQYHFSPETTRAQSPASVADSIDNNGRTIRIGLLHDGRLAAGPSMNRMWVQNMEILDLSDAGDGVFTLLDEVLFL